MTLSHFLLLRHSGGAPNYYRNTFNGPDVTDRNRHLEHATFESGMAARHEASDDDNYSQPRVFYQVRTSTITNIWAFDLMFESSVCFLEGLG